MRNPEIRIPMTDSDHWDSGISNLKFQISNCKPIGVPPFRPAGC
jgi:hypothetical protein